MNTESPHLDLEELLAETDGEAAGGPAQEHLAACPRCRAEAERWRSVAAGVRHLVAGIPSLSDAEVVPGTGARRRPRPLLVAAVAAGILVLGGTSYGLAAALGGSAHPGGTGSAVAGLTAVIGCPSLELAEGTLEQAHGTSLVIATASGHRVIVATSANTMMIRVRAPFGVITDGTRVAVTGTGRGGVIAAGTVFVNPPIHANLPQAFVAGTVSGAGSDGFTMVTAHGARIRVTPSSYTEVTVFRASPSQFQVGGRVEAVGTAGPDGTLIAAGAVQGAALTATGHQCSAAAIMATVPVTRAP